MDKLITQACEGTEADVTQFMGFPHIKSEVTARNALGTGRYIKPTTHRAIYHPSQECAYILLYTNDIR